MAPFGQSCLFPRESAGARIGNKKFDREWSVSDPVFIPNSYALRDRHLVRRIFPLQILNSGSNLATGSDAFVIGRAK